MTGRTLKGIHNMNKHTLKQRVTETGSYFFTRDTMRFFGDTMANYSLASKPVTITDRKGNAVVAWELRRKRPVKHGLQSPAYFRTVDFARVFPTTEGGR